MTTSQTFAVCMFLVGCGGYAEPQPTPVDSPRDPTPEAIYEPSTVQPSVPGSGIKTVVCRVHTDAEKQANLPPRDYPCTNGTDDGAWRWGVGQFKCVTSFPEVGETCEMYNGEPGRVVLK